MYVERSDSMKHLSSIQGRTVSENTRYPAAMTVFRKKAGLMEWTLLGNGIL